MLYAVRNVEAVQQIVTNAKCASPLESVPWDRIARFVPGRWVNLRSHLHCDFEFLLLGQAWLAGRGGTMSLTPSWSEIPSLQRKTDSQLNWPAFYRSVNGRKYLNTLKGGRTAMWPEESLLWLVRNGTQIYTFSIFSWNFFFLNW